MALGKLPDDDAADEGSETIFAEINITPLTDVFLVMVIIFMLSALAVQVAAKKEKEKKVTQQEQSEVEKRSGLKITLPQGKAQEIDTSKASLVLMIPLTGDVEIGGKAMRDADMDAVFAAAFQRDKGTQVILKADKGVAHGRVVNLMERAKNAGLTHLAIGTSGG
jgi:biopolymer transport protein ExbD